MKSLRVSVTLWLVTLATMCATCMAAPPVQAQTVRPKVPICRTHNGHQYCLPTHGGSGITPPIFTPAQPPKPKRGR